VRPNHVWCADVTYIPMRRGFLYLVAVMDWHHFTILLRSLRFAKLRKTKGNMDLFVRD